MPEALISLLMNAQTIAICSHVSPDGDAVGSALAIKMGLEQLGKQVSVFCQDKVPDVLHMCRGWEQYTHDAAGQRFDLLLCVDVSDERRMGHCVCLLDQVEHTAQIDHHGTNPMFCEVNVVDADAPAAGILAYALLRSLGVAITRDMAICLYAAISTDTGNFSFSSTNAETFRMMTALMECDLPLSQLNKRLFRLRPRCQAELLGRVLGSLTFYHGGEVSITRLSRQDFASCFALPEHADSLVNYGLDIAGVKLTAMVREEADGHIKASLRGVEGMNVAVIAQSFGGGGHAMAAGCTMYGTLDACVKKIVDAMEQALDQQES